MNEKIKKLLESASLIEIKIYSGVYLLYKGDDIVYVGKSWNISTRFFDHKKRKDFDSVKYIPCEADQMDLLEMVLIETLLPLYNMDSSTKKIKGILKERDELIQSLISQLK